ncbi:hypothetical protein M0812_12211 [Anaeramoeba flamelloides]|uniref:Uncharacterized protein n=1 Tax=Anaeramoeba flamelloides TaxID=1746091 RepID=A0AAV7ZMC4_9EUKA|nr:hypothetical protein M0812_12211 [Anaeramoeba flamelloides]
MNIEPNPKIKVEPPIQDKIKIKVESDNQKQTQVKIKTNPPSQNKQIDTPLVKVQIKKEKDFVNFSNDCSNFENVKSVKIEIEKEKALENDQVVQDKEIVNVNESEVLEKIQEEEADNEQDKIKENLEPETNDQTDLGVGNDFQNEEKEKEKEKEKENEKEEEEEEKEKEKEKEEENEEEKEKETNDQTDLGVGNDFQNEEKEKEKEKENENEKEKEEEIQEEADNEQDKIKENLEPETNDQTDLGVGNDFQSEEESQCGRENYECESNHSDDGSYCCSSEDDDDDDDEDFQMEDHECLVEEYELGSDEKNLDLLKELDECDMTDKEEENANKDFIDCSQETKRRKPHGSGHSCAKAPGKKAKPKKKARSRRKNKEKEKKKQKKKKKKRKKNTNRSARVNQNLKKTNQKKFQEANGNGKQCPTTEYFSPIHIYHTK